MPTKLWMPREVTQPGSGREGLDVTWTKTVQRLDFGGWYDSCVGIQGDSLTLREFFDALGITEKDCAKAWKQSNVEVTGPAAVLSPQGPCGPQG